MTALRILWASLVVVWFVAGVLVVVAINGWLLR